MAVGENKPGKSANLLPPWQPGQSGNPAGRPKGARCRFSERFVNDFLADWEQHGAATIAKVREDKPDVYLRTATAILPKVNDDGDDLNDLTPEELDARLADLEARTAALTGGEGAAVVSGNVVRKPH